MVGDFLLLLPGVGGGSGVVNDGNAKIHSVNFGPCAVENVGRTNTLRNRAVLRENRNSYGKIGASRGVVGGAKAAAVESPCTRAMPSQMPA